MLVLLVLVGGGVRLRIQGRDVLLELVLGVGEGLGVEQLGGKGLWVIVG